MQGCLRRGDTMGALVKSVQADVLADCLDLPRLELADAEFTLSVDEGAMADAMRRERTPPKGA